MPYKTFEELEVYKLAREFRKEVYRLIKKLPKDEKYNLVSQMRRASTSLTNNIAEGHGRYHYQENIQFCRQSRGSLSELIDDLNICLDEQYFHEDYLNNLKQKAYEINKRLNGYIAYLGKRKADGEKS
ncbi:MAG TPA: four helix bundle protein [Nitrospirae bacterium]|nr:four helix bundle protein [Nitrospirota bacterium]